MAVIDIRGTHGSGKSTIAHNLIRVFGCKEVLEDNKIIGYMSEDKRLGVVGPYNRVCGGCDGVRDAAEIERRLGWFSARCTHVVMEGILVAHTFKRYSLLAHQYTDSGYGYKFLFLDTPLKNCIARVLSRRIKSGNTKPFNSTNLVRDWGGIWNRVRLKCQEAGHEVIILPWKDPMPTVIDLLTSED